MDTLLLKIQSRQNLWSRRKTLRMTALSMILCLFIPQGTSADSVPSLVIPQVSLVMSSPVHPQVLILIGNSQSMDGTLSGAIMTGSGSLSSNLSSLNNSSSPLNYTVPTGFIPPVQGADAFGQAPYTAVQNGLLVDNGPSRLNVAKEGVEAILQTYMQSTDFGLATYSTSNAQRYGTWVYYMSPQTGDFSFTNIPDEGKRYVTNPCFNYLLASSTTASNCSAIGSFFGTTLVATSLYMEIGASSDDPTINDVLYTGGSLPGTYVTYQGPSPATPFSPNFSLPNYNNGGVLVTYARSVPNIGSFGTSPTNAGFVPYSPQVMYSQRGFGYYGSQSATTGTIVVPMTSAGTTPTITTVNNAINLFLPFLKPETNSASSTEIKAIAVQSPTAGLLTRANSYLGTLNPTSGNGCPQKKYVILISDGLPTQDLNGKLWPPLGSAAALGYGVTATFKADGSLDSTNAQSLTDTINAIKTLKDNGIATYVIGLGAGVDPTVNPQAAATLTAMAVAGGTINYYPATDSTSLVNSLNTILVAIQNGSFTTSAASVSSTQLNNGSIEYLANFISNDEPYLDWTGNLVALKLDPNTGFPTNIIIWQAQPLLDSLAQGLGWFSSRLIATWNPSTKNGVPFQWFNLSSGQQAQLQPSDLFGLFRLQYLRGSSALEKQNGGTFRNRSHILGDIINSQVVYVGIPSGPYQTSSYISFANAQKTRQPMLYVGVNDGMMHAFNATTGMEEFAFIPNGVFSNLINLTSSIYNQSHLYFVDGSPQSGDVQFSDSSWHTIVVGGESAGGRSIYALDVTSPSSISNETQLANSVLWEFTDSDMGLSYSTPQIGQIGVSNSNPLTFAVFFGNGYNSPNNNSVLYAVDPQSGNLLAKINLCTAVPSACNSTIPQGLSSVAVANSNGIQGDPITVVYAGDIQGNLWAIDVDDANPDNWSGRLLFKAKDSLGQIQPITSTPVITINPNYPRRQGLFIMFGTGQLLTAADLTNTQTQTMYGIWDKPLASTTFTRSNLQQQTLSIVPPATSGLSVPLLTVTTNTINWSSLVGWYADLPVAGQRTITNSTILNGAFISTLNTPPASSCGTGFTSTLLELNYRSGGSFLQAQIDVEGNGDLNNQRQFNGGYAVGMGLSDSYANAATYLGTNKSNQSVLLITQSNGTQSAVINPNNNPRKIGWWQLQ